MGGEVCGCVRSNLTFKDGVRDQGRTYGRCRCLLVNDEKMKANMYWLEGGEVTKARSLSKCVEEI